MYHHLSQVRIPRIISLYNLKTKAIDGMAIQRKFRACNNLMIKWLQVHYDSKYSCVVIHMQLYGVLLYVLMPMYQYVQVCMMRTFDHPNFKKFYHSFTYPFI